MSEPEPSGEPVIYLFYLIFYVFLIFILIVAAGIASLSDARPIASPWVSDGRFIYVIFIPAIIAMFLSVGVTSKLHVLYDRRQHPFVLDMSLPRAAVMGIMIFSGISLVAALLLMLIAGLPLSAIVFAGAMAFVIGICWLAIMILVLFSDRQITTRVHASSAASLRSGYYVFGIPLPAAIVIYAISYAAGSIPVSLLFSALLSTG